MAAFVVKLLYSLSEGGLKLTDLTKKKLREAKQYRSADATLSQIVDYFFDVGREILVLRGAYDEITFSVDPEIPGSPVIDAIFFYGLLNYRTQMLIPRYPKFKKSLIRHKNLNHIK